MNAVNPLLLRMDKNDQVPAKQGVTRWIIWSNCWQS